MATTAAWKPIIRDALDQAVYDAILSLGNEAYAVPIMQFAQKRIGRRVPIGAIHSVLDYLEKKHVVRSVTYEAATVRGWRRTLYIVSGCV